MAIAITTLKQRHLFAAFTKVILVSLISVMVLGCATPVGINPVDIQTGYQPNTENALSASQPSEA